MTWLNVHPLVLLRHSALAGAVTVLAASCSNASIIGQGQGGSSGSYLNAGGASSQQGGATGLGTTFVLISADAGADRPSTGHCGDGVLQASEQCDDGNTTGGDGCNAVCQIEANWVCPTPGQPCQFLGTCGNGILTSNKACDDGNTNSGDGCSGDCQTVEPGYICRVPGKPCTTLCGDGVQTGQEQCDDGNTVSGDGCSATCKVETGYACSGSPSVCKPTVCGDGKIEGGEGCDDGNTMPFDGCSEECQVEPNCTGAAGCTSPCGDGIVMGSKQCDDGNQANGDGCSSTCKVEPGWTCTQPPPRRQDDGTGHLPRLPLSYAC